MKKYTFTVQIALSFDVDATSHLEAVEKARRDLRRAALNPDARGLMELVDPFLNYMSVLPLTVGDITDVYPPDRES